jgi:predicted transcriptional regulator
MNTETVRLDVPSRWLQDPALPISVRTLLAQLSDETLTAPSIAAAVGSDENAVRVARQRLVRSGLLTRTFTTTPGVAGRIWSYRP